MSDAGGIGHVTSFMQQSSVPAHAPLPYSGNAPGPMTAQSMGRAPGRDWGSCHLFRCTITCS